MQAAMQRGTFGHAPGEWTDDTQLATCIADAHSDPARTAASILDWFRGKPLDVGVSTSRLLSQVKRPDLMAGMSRKLGIQAASHPRPAGWDPGMANGSLMRTGPACLPYLGNRDKIAESARELSDLTHYDPDGWTGDACVIWSLAIASYIDDSSLNASDLGRVLMEALDSIPEERQVSWFDLVAEALTGLGETPKRNGSAVAAFKCALRAVAHASSLADGLQRAVAMGDDTDTVAAIAGALLGAIHGASAVPPEWRSALHGWTPRGLMYAGDLGNLALEAAGVQVS